MKKQLLIIVCVILMNCMLNGCESTAVLEESHENEYAYSSEESAGISEESNEQSEEPVESDYYQSDPIISKSYSHEQFWGVYPEFLGEWKITEFCAHSRYLLHTAEYLMNNAVGEVLCMSKEGVDFLGVCYSLQPNFNVVMSRYSKLDICTYGGYLDVDKVPLEDGVLYEYFRIFIDNSKLEWYDEKAFGYISFCKIDEDTLFLGIDDVYFVAECCSNDD